MSVPESGVVSVHTGRMNVAPSAIARVRSTPCDHSRRNQPSIRRWVVAEMTGMK